MTDPRCILDREHSERGEVCLASRTGTMGEINYELFVNGSFLMSSYSGPSSIALATATLTHTGPSRPLSVLIGGLGLGFTLRRTLQDPSVARVVVVELEPAIIRWNRDRLGSDNARAMADPRLEVHDGDIVDYITHTSERFFAIMLDTDNGPTWTIHEGNARLYAPAGIEQVARILRPGGTASFWASAPDDAFEAELARTFEKCGLETLVDADEEGRPVDAFMYWAVRGR